MAMHEPTLEEQLSNGRLPSIDEGERVIWDDRVTGLGLRLRAQSAPVWIGHKRVEGRAVKRTFGGLDGMGIEEARDLARSLFDLGGRRLRVAPTLESFVPVFIEDNAGRWRPNTVKSHRRGLMRHAVPVLGAKPVDAITRADVVAWQDGLDMAAGSRNRVLAVLSGLMLHAESVGLRPEGSNPCAGLRRRRSGFKAQYLDDRGFARLAAAFDHLKKEHPVEVALLRFLMLTGARLGEALMLEWTMIHGSRAVLPDSKTGPKTLWLCAPVRRLLATLARKSMSSHVFALSDGRKIRGALDRCWAEVRCLAGLQGFRLHDLRHSYASVAVSTGEDQKTVAGLLGHAELETTKGYAHLAVAPIQAAAGRISGHLAEALTPAIPVEPIRSLPRKQTKRRRRKPKLARPKKPATKLAKTVSRGAKTKTPASKTKTPCPWQPHIDAFRQSDLRLEAFCRQRGLDADHFHHALRAYRRQRKAEKEISS